MDRRTFIATSAIASIAGTLPLRSLAQSFDPKPGRWHTYELVTRVEVLRPAGGAHVWIPVPAVASGWQKPLATSWKGNGRTMEQITDNKYDMSLVYADWVGTEQAPWIEVTSRFQTQDRSHDWSRKDAPAESAATLAVWTQPSELITTDGIVKKTADDAVRGRSGDLEKTRALYNWVVDNSYREPKVRGCGIGDIRTMLETGNLGGKCADLNALFVGMARSQGIPARDVYGIRVAKSAFGYKALGAGTADVTRAQHCRAEVHLAGHGWVAMDPADVLKVMREETPEWIKTTTNATVAPVNTKLFGGWEGNWVGYNVAHDVALPGSKGPKVAFFMYPQAETGEGRLDTLDPDNFKYRISAREITGA